MRSKYAYILKVEAAGRTGLVAAISGFLARRDGSAQLCVESMYRQYTSNHSCVVVAH